MSARRGFALVAALWLLVTMASVALAVALDARARRLIVANRVDDARARAAADAGLAHARARLDGLLRDDELRAALSAGGRTRDPWARLDTLLRRPVALGDGGYAVTLRDAGATLNLDHADEDELRTLFTGLRVDAGDADRLAQAVLDWRDADDLPRPRGAEASEYLQRGAAVLPRNAPFRDVNELGDVRGMTPALLARLRPFLGVAGSGRVDLSTAPPPVILALPGMTDESVAAILRYRSEGRPIPDLHTLAGQLSSGAARRLTDALPRLNTAVSLRVEEVDVVSEGWSGGGARVRSEALLVRGIGSPYLWRRVLP